MGEGATVATSAGVRQDDPVQDVLRRIETSWTNLMRAIAGLPEERLTEAGVSGDWSVKDLMGHVAVWDEYVIDAARRLLAGEPRWDVPWETINQREATASADHAVAQQRIAMAQAHARMLAFVAALNPSEVRTDGVERRIAVDTYEHYDEHAADIRAWRERTGI